MKIRQGDVVLRKVTSFPDGLTEKDKVIALGELTGHKHRFDSEAVCVFKDKENTQYVDVKQESELIHEEHANLKVPKGKYVVVVQREVDLLGEVRQVMD